MHPEGERLGEGLVAQARTGITRLPVDERPV